MGAKVIEEETNRGAKVIEVEEQGWNWVKWSLTENSNLLALKTVEISRLKWLAHPTQSGVSAGTISNKNPPSPLLPISSITSPYTYQQFPSGKTLQKKIKGLNMSL